MTGSLRARAFAGFLPLCLVAAACGGDDSSSASSGTVDSGVKSGVDQALSGSATTAEITDQPTSMEEWEALWAEERAAVVAEITENGWGKSADGNTLTGPEGFTVDLAACPAGWSDTEGLTDTTIKIGNTLSQSGTTADYGYLAVAIRPLLAHYSAEGAFTDSEGKTRTVDYITKDDAYDPARTIPLVDELIDSDKVFDVWTLGSPNTMKTYDKLNQRCIPGILQMTGHPAWGDPVNHPWTTGMQMAYNTEAVLWGGFIEQRLDELAPDGGTVKVAALVMNNDFGKSYDAAFKDYLAQSPHKDRIEYVTELIEPQVPTVKDPLTTIASQDPDVFIVMSTGVPCTQSITEASENGLKESADYMFMSSVCQSSGFVGKEKVGGDGSATTGWWIVGGGVKDLVSPDNDGDPFIEWSRELLTNDGTDYTVSGSLTSGIYFGWSMVQALRIAGDLPGGLTRTNLILAARAMDMTHPSLIPGIQFNMNGNADAYFVEGSQFGQYDAELQNWVTQGDIIDLSGKSANCAWDQSTSTCT
ncbi:MAG: ABC transporter substrate-binding protein [Acidimicrobiia bacterium]|nr:ABC transporter substrate-binding protein [Acidimicrobiia bacterium]